jgi:hypothetical protein
LLQQACCGQGLQGLLQLWDAAGRTPTDDVEDAFARWAGLLAWLVFEQ